MKDRIIVVDDDKEIAKLIKISLENEGYSIDVFYNGEMALKAINKNKYSLAVLDVMLPGIDGYQLCKEIREKYFFPILMITAKRTDMDKITGLMLGADDYITKPFNPMEVVMRVKAQFRRMNIYSCKENEPLINEIEQYDIKGLSINRKTYICILNGEQLTLTPTEFEILWYLCCNKGNVVYSEDLFEHVWGEKYLENNNTVMAHVTRLREKMHEIPRKPKYIKTIWGLGYKIE